MGSIVTAIIFATNWIFYWALESQILGSSIASYFGIPESVGWILVGAILVPLTLYGMVFVTKFQNWTIPIFLVWLAWNVVVVFRDHSSGSTDGFFSYVPDGAQTGWTGLFGVIAAVNGLIAVIPLLSMEFARFARPSDSAGRKRRGYLAVAALPQNVFAWLIYLPIGILIWRASGTENPGEAFVHLTGWIGFLGLFITQVRINLQNTYAESLALSTLFARIFKFRPGRAFWSLATCVIGTLLIFLNMLQYINQVLEAEAILLFAWVGVLIADLAVVRGLMRAPVGEVEHRRAYLRRYNPAGLTSFACGVVVGAALHYVPKELGATSTSWGIVMGLASFIGFAVAFILHPLIIWWLDRRATAKGASLTDFYLARAPETVAADLLDANNEFPCSTCGVVVEADDASNCPVTASWICSECCASNRTCRTACQTGEPTFVGLPSSAGRTRA